MMRRTCLHARDRLRVALFMLGYHTDSVLIRRVNYIQNTSNIDQKRFAKGSIGKCFWKSGRYHPFDVFP